MDEAAACAEAERAGGRMPLSTPVGPGEVALVVRVGAVSGLLPCATDLLPGTVGGTADDSIH